MTEMNKYIAVAYQLYTKDKEGKRELVENATKEQPFQFVSGLGMTLDDFEKQKKKKKKGR